MNPMRRELGGVCEVKRSSGYECITETRSHRCFMVPAEVVNERGGCRTGRLCDPAYHRDA